MGRIAESEIERIKAEISVEQLVRARGIELKKSGKDWLGRCPFHADDTPSLVVTPAKNLWHCFGCQIGGGPIDWTMKAEGVSFRHAAELLREGISSLAAAAGVKHASMRALAAPVVPDADDAALLAQVVDYYHQTLKQSPEALTYLESRGIAREAVEHFQLGFANRTLGLRLPLKNRHAGEAIRARLTALGILRESGHEHMNGCVVFPWFDAAGRVDGMYGRKIVEKQSTGIKHVYLPGPHRGVFNAAALAGQQEVILCEAIIDALTFWSAGYPNVTASYGVEGFTPDHLALFKSCGVKRVLIAYDRDDAGDKAAAKLSAKLQAEGMACHRIEFPHGMDANEYAGKVTPAAQSLGVLIRRAAWLGQGKPPAVPARQDMPAAAACAASTAPASAAPVPVAVAAPPAAINAAPSAPPLPLAFEVQGDDMHLQCEDRHYRVRGLDKCAGTGNAYALKVNVLARVDDRFYVDTLDLYSARHRVSFIAHAAVELQRKEEVLKTDLGRVLLALEQWQGQTERQAQAQPDAAPMNEEDRAAALALLRSPDLLARIVADFDAAGVVGETTNKLAGYLAAVSRKLDAPLAVVIQSSSAAGKSSLMDAVLAFVPEEERIKYSAMTGQSLFYMGETNLKHKILAICEEEGASRAAYALKLLQSDGELTMASTGKDPATGNLVTQQYRVEGPVMIFLTTTAIDIDEELMNRCLVLTVDEGREQTEAIHRLQRRKRTLEGLRLKQEKERLLSLHRNAQRLLKPLAVVNPHADRLTFLSDKTRTRRDHEKYLTLIDTIALLHQHQREVRYAQGLEYIEATAADIDAANRIAHEVLGRSLDELPPVTRRVLAVIDELVRQRMQRDGLARAGVRFTRRDVREATGLSDTPLRAHLERLTQLEYLLTHRGSKGQSFEYELLFDGDPHGDAPHLCGLLDMSTNPTSLGLEGGFAGGSLPVRSPNAGATLAALSGAEQETARLAPARG